MGIEPPFISEWEARRERVHQETIRRDVARRAASAIKPPFISPHYQRCDDRQCPDAYAFIRPFPEVPHWHFVGSPDHPTKETT
jgi:hypothetical protein